MFTTAVLNEKIIVIIISIGWTFMAKGLCGLFQVILNYFLILQTHGSEFRI